jgi:hypothetical protein
LFDKIYFFVEKPAAQVMRFEKNTGADCAEVRFSIVFLWLQAVKSFHIRGTKVQLFLIMQKKLPGGLKIISQNRL